MKKQKKESVRSCVDCVNMVSISDEYGYTHIECSFKKTNLNLVDREAEAKDCDKYIKF